MSCKFYEDFTFFSVGRSGQNQISSKMFLYVSVSKMFVDFIIFFKYIHKCLKNVYEQYDGRKSHKR